MAGARTQAATWNFRPDSSVSRGSATQEVVPGTLDLMVLKTPDAIGPQHGYGLARRIEQLSEDLLR